MTITHFQAERCGRCERKCVMVTLVVCIHCVYILFAHPRHNTIRAPWFSENFRGDLGETISPDQCGVITWDLVRFNHGLILFKNGYLSFPPPPTWAELYPPQVAPVEHLKVPHIPSKPPVFGLTPRRRKRFSPGC